MKKNIFVAITMLALCQFALSAMAQDTQDTPQQVVQQIQALQQRQKSAQQEVSQQAEQRRRDQLQQQRVDEAARQIAQRTATPPSPRSHMFSAAQTSETRYRRSSNFRAPFTAAQVHLSPTLRSANSAAFSNTVLGLLPMTPLEIHRLKQLYTASQYAAAAPAGVPPKPTATSLFVNLSPGATPPAINLSEGDITALVFLDSTGAPWPIAAVDNGNPNSFNIQWDKKDNILMIQAVSAFGRGNLAVRLKGLNTPVMISLITNSTREDGGGTVDYRVDMRVPGYGPDAKPVPISGLPGTASPILLNVLDGIPPNGSTTLHVSGDLAQAWLVKDHIFLRTHLTLLSPGWLATMSSADGTHAYELQQAPLLLMSDHGKMIQVKISGF